MDELKPCPFCGGSAKSWHTRDDFWCSGRAGCANEDCYIRPVVRGTDELAAINLWNTRYEPTCHWKENKRDWDDSWNTSCGEYLTWEPFGTPKYCPGCGARVEVVG